VQQLIPEEEEAVEETTTTVLFFSADSKSRIDRRDNQIGNPFCKPETISIVCRIPLMRFNYLNTPDSSEHTRTITNGKL
jgi:hypothetical protein